MDTAGRATTPPSEPSSMLVRGLVERAAHAAVVGDFCTPGQRPAHVTAERLRWRSIRPVLAADHHHACPLTTFIAVLVLSSSSLSSRCARSCRHLHRCRTLQVLRSLRERHTQRFEHAFGATQAYLAPTGAWCGLPRGARRRRPPGGGRVRRDGWEWWARHGARRSDRQSRHVKTPQGTTTRRRS